VLLTTAVVFYHRLFPDPIVDPIVNRDTYLTIIGLQPNVPMTLVKTTEETQELLARHLSMSKQQLEKTRGQPGSRLLIWPESPMNFAYASDRQFQEIVTRFAIENQTSLLFNSQEPAPAGGIYNSAVLINEKGRVISQYDKIRLLPFGEYVPLPRWLPSIFDNRYRWRFHSRRELHVDACQWLSPRRCFHLHRVGLSVNCANHDERWRERSDQHLERRVPWTDCSDATTPGECSVQSRGKQSQRCARYEQRNYSSYRQ